MAIAHRLSTIQDADCIYVLETGVESGNHQELLAQVGSTTACISSKQA